jgi:hypothetical protein
MIVPLSYIGIVTVLFSPGERVMPCAHPRPSNGAFVPRVSAVLSYSSTSTAIRSPGGIPEISPRPWDRSNQASMGVAMWGARTRIRMRFSGNFT